MLPNGELMWSLVEMEVKNFMLQVIVMLCITVDILMSKSKVLNNIPAISHESSRIVLSHWSVTNQRSKIKGMVLIIIPAISYGSSKIVLSH